MDALALLAVLWTRRTLRARERWTRIQLERHQARALSALREHAYAHSPFYRRFHRGLERAPLGQLPVLTKDAVMDHFDDLVTDRAVRRTDVESYFPTASATGRYVGRYRVSVTGGTSGRRGIFLANAREWTTVLASYSRAYAWAGLQVGPAHPLRMAIVSSLVPTHQSSIVGATVRNPFVPTLRLDATESFPENVEALNAFQPGALVGYASTLGTLAGEQMAGRLRIAPRAVFSASEVLTPEGRAAMLRAWGSEPFNVYAATETAGVASECQQHHLHRYEDLVIAEAVDQDYHAVPEGSSGDKLLVTVLFNRTQPLIRYELDDRVRFSAASPVDLGPFRTVDAIEGRTEDELLLPGRNGGAVRVHPNVLHAILEPLDAPWQVIRHPDRLEILLAASRDLEPVRQSVAATIERLGARPMPITVRCVDAIPRTAIGKRPLVVVRRHATPTLS